MTTWVYVDESKRAGYVLAAAAVPDPEAARKIVRSLILPGQRRLHMNHEQPRRRRTIVSALVTTPVETTIYDAARRYPTERAARAACLAGLVEDLAAAGDTRLVIEQDDSLVRSDRRELYQLARAAGITDVVEYRHQRAYAEPCLHSPTSWPGAGLAPVTGVDGSPQSLAPSEPSDPRKRKARAPPPSGRVSGLLPAASVPRLKFV